MDETGSTERVPYTRVTVAEAATILGVNVVTVRRMIKRGQLEAERVHRPQGSAYLVTLPGHGADDEASTEQPAQDMPRTQGTVPAPAEAMVSLIQTTIGTVLGPLVGQLDAQRQTIERQADQLVSQAEVIGTLRAENEALKAPRRPRTRILAPLCRLATTDGPATVTARLRALAPWLLAVLAITAAVVLLVVR